MLARRGRAAGQRRDRHGEVAHEQAASALPLLEGKPVALDDGRARASAGACAAARARVMLGQLLRNACEHTDQGGSRCGSRPTASRSEHRRGHGRGDAGGARSSPSTAAAEPRSPAKASACTWWNGWANASAGMSNCAARPARNHRHHPLRRLSRVNAVAYTRCRGGYPHSRDRIVVPNPPRKAPVRRGRRNVRPFAIAAALVVVLLAGLGLAPANTRPRAKAATARPCSAATSAWRSRHRYPERDFHRHRRQPDFRAGHRVLVDFNSRVSRGEVLARIDPSTCGRSSNRQRADRQRARATGAGAGHAAQRADRLRARPTSAASSWWRRATSTSPAPRSTRRARRSVPRRPRSTSRPRR